MTDSKKEKTINILLTAVLTVSAVFTAFSASRVSVLKKAFDKKDAVYTALAESCTDVRDMSASNGSKTENSGKKGSAFPVLADFASLNEKCAFGSAAGWVYCPDTVINYPVLQCDDNYYYLHHLIDGTENGGGTLYCDYRCESCFSGQSTIVYGHHMTDGSMLASIQKYYKEEDYYSAHPVIYLATPNGNYILEVFSAFATTTEDDKSFACTFSSDYNFGDYIEHLKGMNSIPGGTDIEVGAGDRVVSFVTCAYHVNNGRSILACKMSKVE